MRKIIAIALFLILATFLVAFGGCEEETTTPEGEKGKPDELAYERGTYVLEVCLDSMSEDYFPFLCFLTVHIV